VLQALAAWVGSLEKEKLMKRYVLAFVVVVAVGGMVSADDKTDAEVKNLEGDWEIEALEIKGKKIEVPKGKGGGGFVFAKDRKLTIKEPGKPDKPGTYKIDAAATPKQIDLIEAKNDSGKSGETMHGIYEVEGESLKLAFSADGPKGKRPNTFTGGNVMILHLKRKKS
jgi:uncharacterized protein (TIGR03067 family)